MYIHIYIYSRKKPWNHIQAPILVVTVQAVSCRANFPTPKGPLFYPAPGKAPLAVSRVSGGSEPSGRTASLAAKWSKSDPSKLLHHHVGPQ